MRPYYHDEASGITIHHGDCRDVLPTLAVGSVDLVLTDPPYGISERTDRASKGRGQLAPCNDFPPVFGDNQTFDPTHLLVFKRLILWGANYYADKLPPSPSWLVWDKRDGMPSNDNADCEMAWSNLGGPARLYHHRWNGMIKASEREKKRVHPTQKPVVLMAWIIGEHTVVGDRVLDPYMGSGPVLRAAKDLGRRAIGIEIEERYCEIAAKRLQQAVLPLGVA